MTMTMNSPFTFTTNDSIVAQKSLAVATAVTATYAILGTIILPLFREAATASAATFIIPATMDLLPFKLQAQTLHLPVRATPIMNSSIRQQPTLPKINPLSKGVQTRWARRNRHHNSLYPALLDHSLSLQPLGQFLRKLFSPFLQQFRWHIIPVINHSSLLQT